MVGRVCPFGSEDWVCNDESLCFRCETAAHEEAHPDGGVEGCLQCKLGTLYFSPSCRGQARNNLPPEGTAGRNSWEKGIATDERGLPFRDAATGAPITVKRYAENRQQYEESRRANRSGAIV